jgi:hypothetical protein
MWCSSSTCRRGRRAQERGKGARYSLELPIATLRHDHMHRLRSAAGTPPGCTRGHTGGMPAVGCPCPSSTRRTVACGSLPAAHLALQARQLCLGQGGVNAPDSQGLGWVLPCPFKLQGMLLQQASRRHTITLLCPWCVFVCSGGRGERAVMTPGTAAQRVGNKSQQHAAPAS